MIDVIQDDMARLNSATVGNKNNYEANGNFYQLRAEGYINT